MLDDGPLLFRILIMISTAIRNSDLDLSRDITRSPDFRVVFVGAALGSNIPKVILCQSEKAVQLDSVSRQRFPDFLEHTIVNAPLAAVFVFSERKEECFEIVENLRKIDKFRRTRVYLVSSQFGSRAVFGHSMDVDDRLDIERAIDPSQFDISNLVSMKTVLDLAIDAYQALKCNPLMPDYYLDATFDKLFDWFESTRWDWSEVGDLSNIQKNLVTPNDIEILKESTIIEFGTLPGAHNFLREWGDEYSFSSWTLSWGAEESRHSLLQCRYLSLLGTNIRAKHAMYKRQPYPIGENHAGTLMMNIISESRAAEYYLRLASQTQEPMLKKIWKLLGQDEARHARAFFIFCKELCDNNEANLLEAFKMAYVWLADRDEGVKHPAGHFFPHSTSADGLKGIENGQDGMTDRADARVYAMCKKIANDESINSPKDLKRVMRDLIYA